MSRITIQTSAVRFDTAPDLYGIFFEDINHAGDGGIYPEMLRNRSFEDSLLPEGCTTDDGGKTFVSPTGWVDEFNNGEGMNEWVRDNHIIPTPVPAWYPENCTVKLDSSDTLNDIRKVSLSADFEQGGQLRNIGYAGIPQEDGKEYHFYCFAKADAPVPLRISVEEGDTVYSEASLTISGTDWTRYDAVLRSSGTTGNGAFILRAPEGGRIRFGFSSLMPADTYNGHGLRKDLVEKLKALHPGFMRFPGGCIVEGFTMETAMFFRKTIGPVWERPSFWLLWHYRTTNGLGFHEYLQLCEDLGAEPMYVCNCGMTCQGRNPYYFNEEETDDILQDTLDALEYALGSSATKWGALRAEMGHPEPFRLKYLEIGNENHGPEYIRRYLYIRERIQKQYPEILILANTKDEELAPDIVDDHYYNMPEFYAENVGIYDDYDRSKPDVFVGEFSVNQTYEGQVRGAVAEAMFMTGFERNQDKIRLCSYAPLLSHEHYHSWFPNLIMYDNYRSCAIPSYYAFRVFGNNRGQKVLESVESSEIIYRELHGFPFVAGTDGTVFKNAVLNGLNAYPVRNVHGKHEQHPDSVILRSDPEELEAEPPFYRNVDMITALASAPSDIDLREGCFEADVLIKKDAAQGIGILLAPKPLSFYDRMQPVPTDPWKMFNLEPLRLVIRDGKAFVERGLLRPKTLAEVPFNQADGEFHRLSCIYTASEAVFFADGNELVRVTLPNYPSMSSVVTASDDEIIVKIVNFSDDPDDVAIVLDADVESSFTVDRFYGKADAENTLDDPEHVSDERVTFTGASRDFVYQAPGMSVNALRLKLKK